MNPLGLADTPTRKKEVGASCVDQAHQDGFGDGLFPSLLRKELLRKEWTKNESKNKDEKDPVVYLLLIISTYILLRCVEIAFDHYSRSAADNSFVFVCSVVAAFTVVIFLALGLAEIHKAQDALQQLQLQQQLM